MTRLLMILLVADVGQSHVLPRLVDDVSGSYRLSEPMLNEIIAYDALS